MSNKRAIVIVLDSLGIGALPDAAAFGDEGSCTLGHIWERMMRCSPARAMAKWLNAPAARIPRPAIGK